ncbi:hypothetical protein [Halococcus saccharolyticus]|uniref:Uncharacterized protein n=1 Tax=Halococcus saccharolyticus DSM 5350 TaxID=1227455 RepID=M0MU87_9EURY|nr:hypothetical protein [Halococcus saccharolyticus]EMA47995.1 hypothetical protein C449_00945 [Halococcus saccharolyticus DSM 5350]
MARNQKTVRSKEGTLTIGNQDIDVTNVEATIEISLSSTDWSNRPEQYTGWTSVHTTGTYEWEGVSSEAETALVDTNGHPLEEDAEIQFNNPNGSYVFREVYPASVAPSWDMSSFAEGSVEWEADIARLP